MTEALVLVERAGRCAIVTMNRPKAMNALSRALRRDLSAAIKALDADDGVDAIVLTGAGTRAFTAGLDLKELGSDPAALGEANGNERPEDPVAAVTACSKPVIGAVNGVAITGGFELALACDILIASDNARFADTHARVGIMPGWGLSQKLSRAIGLSRAKELSLTGNFIDARTALAWGLVNRVVPAEDLIPLACAICQDMQGADQSFLRAYLKLIDEGYALALGDATALEQARSRAHNAQVSPSSVEDRRRAVQDWGRDQPGSLPTI
ncbi:enoyl-CoA hydratase [Novosphingobium cyanobacteriorum]|uniref:Enoyl-CoA hydratase n=1 Tax=Novosphingobium cyanobacteriorum TaxID=3024215 RepID=A0ABT6CE34_9SPHN|nr:enoyl-CoA hydratase [Novosphingobium cyanobacteriorum]MDF8332189.1 enoyl-CoA hydratase [Novosphingobium cyanobacteriorum]